MQPAASEDTRMAISPLSSKMQPTNGHAVRNGNGDCSSTTAVPVIPLTYDSSNSETSARRLIHSLRPAWDAPTSKTLAFVRFTDGITNTLLKAENRLPGLSKADIDRDAILLRAYGNGTDVLIDRQRETENHELLMRHGLAPELLASFENGIMYKFVRGSVTTPQDMRRPEISTAIARRLAEWHAVVPCLPSRTDLGCGIGEKAKENGKNGHGKNGQALQDIIDNAAAGKLPPNVWTVIQKWLFALPTETEAQRSRQSLLQTEFEWLVTLLSQRPGLGHNSLVFGHADLLSGNVIIMPDSETPASASKLTTCSKPGTTTTTEEQSSGNGVTQRRPSVTFIDYEYAVPSPAAFDIANHFAEWGGFDCDHSVLPTASQRRLFVEAYMDSYLARLPPTPPPSSPSTTTSNDGSASPINTLDAAEETEKLLLEIDLFRGAPGFYWGVWALIQATISEIDFDYASYAEIRLGEYFAWKAELEGTRKGEMPIREKRWAEE